MIDLILFLFEIVGGQEKIRPLWKHYYAGVNGIIFVVDSNDKDRLEEASEELHKLLREEQLQRCPVLVSKVVTFL
jgi:GTPase SAR1 family protein